MTAEEIKRHTENIIKMERYKWKLQELMNWIEVYIVERPVSDEENSENWIEFLQKEASKKIKQVKEYVKQEIEKENK